MVNFMNIEVIRGSFLPFFTSKCIPTHWIENAVVVVRRCSGTQNAEHLKSIQWKKRIFRERKCRKADLQWKIDDNEWARAPNAKHKASQIPNRSLRNLVGGCAFHSRSDLLCRWTLCFHFFSQFIKYEWFIWLNRAATSCSSIFIAHSVVFCTRAMYLILPFWFLIFIPKRLRLLKPVALHFCKMGYLHDSIVMVRILRSFRSHFLPIEFATRSICFFFSFILRNRKLQFSHCLTIQSNFGGRRSNGYIAHRWHFAKYETRKIVWKRKRRVSNKPET